MIVATAVPLREAPLSPRRATAPNGGTQVAAAVASSDPAPARKQQSRDPATPMPQLLGTQVRVLWGDEWYQGVGGDSKLEDGVWITRVAYDANGTWRKCSMWHNLANEAWEQM